MNAKVSLIRGNDRYASVSRALDEIAAQIDFTGKSRVLVKPNLVDHRQLSATHNDALRAVLDFVRARYDGPLTVAEGTTLHNTWDSFRHYDYEALARTLIELTPAPAEDATQEKPEPPTADADPQAVTVDQTV